MADLLGRLVDRALGTGPVVRPRIASRYEAGGVGAPATTPVPDAEPGDGHVRLRRSTPPVEQEPSEAAPAVPLPAATILREPPREPRAAARAHNRAVSAVSRHGPTSVAEQTGEPGPHVGSISLPTRASPQPPLEGAMAGTTAGATADVVMSRQAAAGKRPDRAAHRDARAGAPVIDDVPEPPASSFNGRAAAPTPAPSSPRAATHPAPSLDPPRERAASRAAIDPHQAAVDPRPAWPIVATPRSVPTAVLMPAAVEESRPVIRVTIGRIEVRAVAPPAPPRRSAAPVRDPSDRGLAPSLEEYLRARNGRSR